MTPAIQQLAPTASAPAGLIASTALANSAGAGRTVGDVTEGEFSRVDHLVVGLEFRATTTEANENRLKRKFEYLAEKRREETAVYSSVADKALNKHYQQIIGQGMAIVPYILQELKKGPHHWYWALAAITGADPAADAPEGDIRAICDRWV